MEFQTVEQFRTAAIAFGNESLLISPNGQSINLAEGYIPLLVNFSFEDKAAKGLRKRHADDKIEAPMYFSAFEVVRDNKYVLLTGPTGSGKTSLAKHLAFRLAMGGSHGEKGLLRNEEGAVHVEDWDLVATTCYFDVDGAEMMRMLIRDKILQVMKEVHGVKLIILDSIEKVGDEGSALLEELLMLVRSFDNVKLLILGDSNVVKPWLLPPEYARHDLLPLLEVRRKQTVSFLFGDSSAQNMVGLGAAAACPAFFALALEAGSSADSPEALLDAWLAVVAPEQETCNRLTTVAYEKISHVEHPRTPAPSKVLGPALLSLTAVQPLLAARHLVNLPIESAVRLFYRDPTGMEPVLRSLIRRSVSKKQLLTALLEGSGIEAQHGALLASDFVPESSPLLETVRAQMLAIIEDGILPILYREKAGRVLSRLGDPRDLIDLATVPTGHFTLGSEIHSNSCPPHTIFLEEFRVGVFPVINRDFAQFVRETGRKWQSPDGFEPERSNAPATDLSWYDAVAYCEWLTSRWRASGKIGRQEHVRLPTEPEWERAARGDIDVLDNEPVYPWGRQWQHDAANYEESGINARCSVGLFPKGRSLYECFDMTGQVWEWCSTLWGEDMATPSCK